MRTGELINEIKLDWTLEQYEEPRIELSWDGKYLLTHQMEVWDVRTEKRIYDLGTGRVAQSYQQIWLAPESKQLGLGITQDSFLIWNLEQGRMDPAIQRRKTINSGSRKVILEPEHNANSNEGNAAIRQKNIEYGVVWERFASEVDYSETFTINSGKNISPSSDNYFESMTGCVVFPEIGRKGLLFISDDINGLYSLDMATPTNWKKTRYEGGGSANDLEVLEELDLLVHYSDNATRIWKLGSGEQLATLYRFGTADWVVINPDGFFDASPGAIDELYFTLFDNNLWEVIELEQLKERYYEPGLLSKVLGYGDQAIRDVAPLKQIALYPEVAPSI
jgi:hypothetical protein